MPINNFGFDNSDVTETNEGYKNATDFPDPINETQTRLQLQKLLSQIRKWLNDNIVVNINNSISHIANVSNPHSVTKTQIGLGNVDNTSDTDKPVSTAQSTAISNAVSAHSSLTNNPHSVTKSQVGLGNVDNTSDLNKPISTAVQNAINSLSQSITTALSGKVDKVSGKGLSTNDYTTTEKNKLGGIQNGAEVNVQSDWDMADSSQGSYIQHKPHVPSVSVSASGTSQDEVNYITIDGVEKKLAGGGSGGTSDYNALNNKPQINGVTLSGDKSTKDLGLVQVYYVTSDTTSDDYIANFNKEMIYVNGGYIYRKYSSMASGGSIKWINFFRAHDAGKFYFVTATVTTEGTTFGEPTIITFQELLVSGTNIKTINGQSVLGSGDIPVASNPTEYTISVSGTPVSMGEYMEWDDYSLYPFKMDISVSGITANSVIVGLGANDNLLSAIANHITTDTDKITLYAETSAVLTGTLKIRTLEKANG